MSLYEILGVKEDSPIEEIKQRFRELSKIHHPDINGGNGNGEKFREIHNAYRILSNPKKRKRYDKDGYIEPEESFIKEKVKSKIFDITNGWINSVFEDKAGNTSLLRFFNINLKEGRKVLTQNIYKIEKTEKILQKTLKKLSYNDSENSIIHVLMKQRLTDLQNSKNSLKIELHILEEISKEVLKYAMKENGVITETLDSINQEPQQPVNPWFNFSTA